MLVEYVQRNRGATTAKSRFSASDDGNLFCQSIMNVMRCSRTRLVAVGTGVSNGSNLTSRRLGRYLRV